MKKRGRRRGVVRLFGRLTVAAVLAVVCTLTAIQFVRIVDENLAMARSLSDVRRDVAALRARKREQELELHRLLLPRGAVPEIHERLHLVGPNEAIIYLQKTSRTAQ